MGKSQRQKGKITGGKAARRFKRKFVLSEEEDEDPRKIAKIQREVNREYEDQKEAEKEEDAALVSMVGAEPDMEDVEPPKMAAQESIEEGTEGQAAQGEGEKPVEKPDPYLMADAAYIQKDTRWRNKQRTLVFTSRGVTSQFRHLAEDFKKLLPHHKTEPKFEKRENLHSINEICELKSCNNVVYFEARKRKDLYMWVGRVPQGPSMKFQILNIHTTMEVRLAGNCLLGSRPILYFDKSFDKFSFLKLIKEMFTQVFGTPRNHPKSKPFHDHAMCFYWLDRKIWFRHYQISPEGPDDANEPERQQLTEMGPRFVLDPVRVLGGSFCGSVIYNNPFYMSPTALRRYAKSQLRSPYLHKLRTRDARQKHIKELELPPDPLDEVFE